MVSRPVGRRYPLLRQVTGEPVTAIGPRVITAKGTGSYHLPGRVDFLRRGLEFVPTVIFFGGTIKGPRQVGTVTSPQKAGTITSPQQAGEITGI